MKQILLSLPVHGKRNLVLIRQRTRQMASLLGFGADDQATLAAAVFDLACQRLRGWGRTTWIFLVQDRYLRIFPDSRGEKHVRIEKRLPEIPTLSAPDIQWVAGELSRLATVDVFGEIQKMNQELLHALLEAREYSRVRTVKPAA